MAKPDSQRLFFALWPEPETALAIWEVAGRLVSKGGGRRLSPGHLHLTLAFLGALDESRQQCMRQAAATVRGQTFSLRLDEAGHFPRPQVVWLGASQSPSALQELQSQLVTQLAQRCQFEPESRPFVPHLTVWRKIKRVQLPESVPSIEWPVCRFVLASSRTLASGAEYSIVQAWPLSGS